MILLTEILLEDFFSYLYKFSLYFNGFFFWYFFLFGVVNISTLPLGVFSRLTDCLFQKSPSSKNSLFRFFQFFNFLLLYPPLVVSLLRDLDSPPPEFAYYVRMGAQQTVNEDVVMSTDEWRIWEGLMTITKFRGF